MVDTQQTAGTKQTRFAEREQQDGEVVIMAKANANALEDPVSTVLKGDPALKLNLDYYNIPESQLKMSNDKNAILNCKLS